MTNDTPRRFTRSKRISPDETIIEPGWPRPHYVDPVTGKNKYVQWITGYAEENIMNCSRDRLDTAFDNFMCSCCGYKLLAGVMPSNVWWVSNYKNYPDNGDDGNYEVHGPNLTDPDPYDTAYGSPMCFRCSLFALKHCPFFARLDQIFGDDLAWYLVESPDEVSFIDETGAIRVPNSHDKLISTRKIRQRVSQGNLFITDETK